MVKKIINSFYQQLKKIPLFTVTSEKEDQIKELEWKNKVLSVQYRIADAASSSKDLNHFFSDVHQIVSELMYAKNFLIVVYDDETGIISSPYFSDEKDEVFTTKPLDEFHGITGYMIRTGNLIKHGKDQINQLIASGEVMIYGFDFKDGIGTPLKNENRVIGAIFLQSYDETIHYTERDEEILNSLATHITTALTRFLALEAERKRSVELEIVNLIQSGLAEEEPIEKIIDTVGKKLCGIFNPIRITIGLYEKKSNQVHNYYSFEKGNSKENHTNYPDINFLIEKFRENPQCEYFMAGRKANEANFLLPSLKNSKAGIAVPIRKNHHFLGAILLEAENGDYIYGEIDRNLLKSTAISLAEAFEKKQLAQQRNEALEELRKSEEKFRKIVQNLTHYVSIFDLNLHCMYVSPSVFTLTGYTPEERLAQNPNEYFSPETIRILHQFITDGGSQTCYSDLDSDQTITMDLEEIRKDGSIVFFQSSLTFLRDTAGKPNGILVIAADITERKKNEEALRESEQRLLDIINFLPIATIVIDNQSRVTAWNRAVETMTGVKSEDMIGKGNYEYAIPFYGRRVPMLIDLISVSDEILKKRYLHVKHHGNILSAENFCGNLGENGLMLIGFASGLYNSKGELQGAIEALQDVTELRETERKLQDAKELAETANHSKSIFLANMSHEIRTPMNAILGFSQLMEHDSNLTEQQRDNLHIINHSGEHLLALINDILELSKIEAGRSTLVPNNFNLLSMMADLEMMFRVSTDKKGLQLHIEMAEDVPVWVLMDQNKLRQVLINLIGNAVKFTSKGSIIVRINVSPEFGGKELLLFEIEDTGPGISEEEAAKLFEPFEQASSGEKTGGTGLGLSLSQGFVKMMGGIISVSSTIGKGSIFSFAIPYQQGIPGEISQSKQKKRVVGLVSIQDKFRILIVDDSETNRKILTQILTSVGFIVMEAANGAEAVKLFQIWKPRIIFMDMQMPVMDGYEATRKIKQTADGRNVVIVAMTASAFQEDRLKIMEAGVDGYISKPFKVDSLFETITQLTGAAFRYEEEEALNTIIENEDFAIFQKEIHKLPSQKIIDCCRAAENADYFQLIEIIQDIAASHSEIGKKLMDFANRYEYERIIALLKPPGFVQ